MFVSWAKFLFFAFVLFGPFFWFVDQGFFLITEREEILILETSFNQLSIHLFSWAREPLPHLWIPRVLRILVLDLDPRDFHENKVQFAMQTMLALFWDNSELIFAPSHGLFKSKMKNGCIACDKVQTVLSIVKCQQRYRPTRAMHTWVIWSFFLKICGFFQVSVFWGWSRFIRTLLIRNSLSEVFSKPHLNLCIQC